MLFVVAEIGVNWDGDYNLVKDLMSKAKEVGCDAVKFQSFNEDLIKDHPQKNRLIKSAITKSNIDSIDKIAKSIGIEWFSTPMYPEAVDLLDPYVKRFKLRFHDGVTLLQNKTTKLFEKLLKTNKEIIISSQNSPRDCIFNKHEQVKWLYVVPKYPCEISDIDFSMLKDFDGYSNHCPYIIAPLTATILGARIIEVHITADKSRDFIDNPVSFDYIELNELLRLIRLSEKIKTINH